jgi:hypothetical protein
MEWTTMNAEQAKANAAELRQFVKRIDAMMNTLDTNATPCDCCGTTRYRNWKQNQLWAKLEGLAERAETAASAMAKGATDPEFLGTVDAQ